MTFSRITTDAEMMGGQPCIRGPRMPVASIVAMVADGMTVDEIITELPDLTPEDAREALQYAAEAVRQRELPFSAQRRTLTTCSWSTGPGLTVSQAPERSVGSRPRSAQIQCG